MKKIIIPTDFSENAKFALDYALKFIGKTEAKIHIVNAIEARDYFPSVGDIQVNPTVYKLPLNQDNIEALAIFANQYCQENGLEISVSSDTIVGDPANTILEESEKFEADIIIMGTQGMSYSKSKSIGSISKNVMNHTKIPLLLIPYGFEYKELDNILYASDISYADPFILWKACRLLDPHSVVVRCLHVSNEAEQDDPDIKALKDYMISHPASIKTHFYIEEKHKIDSNIIQYSNLYSVDLIVMKKSHKSFWRKLFFGSNLKAVFNQISIPLLVVKNEHNK